MSRGVKQWNISTIFGNNSKHNFVVGVLVFLVHQLLVDLYNAKGEGLKLKRLNGSPHNGLGWILVGIVNVILVVSV